MNILEEASAIVKGVRRKEYGPPDEEFPKLAAMWTAILKTPITAEQVCLCLMAGKLMRLSVSPDHRDSLVDVVGYACIMEEINVSVQK